MGCLEKDFCIKCDKGGKLLSCSDISCPIAVHEKCLGFPVKFDSLGNFYCPYCIYRQATEKLRQAGENAQLRKKALSNFIDKEMINGDKNMSEVGKSEQKGTGKLENTGNLGSEKDKELDETTVRKNFAQVSKEQKVDELALESTRSRSLHKETAEVLLGKENDVLSNKYGDNYRPSQCKDHHVVVGHQTPSGSIVAYGSDVHSEEEETMHHFQLVEIGRRILLEHLKEFNDGRPVKGVENDKKDNHFSDISSREQHGKETYFSHSTKGADNDQNPIGEGKGKIEGEEEMEEEVHESISSFTTDFATPEALEKKGGSESTDTSYREMDPTSASKHVKRNYKRSCGLTNVNSPRRSCPISSSEKRASVEKIEELNAPTGLKQLTEPSSGICNVEQIVELNANTELKQVAKHSSRL